MTAEPPVIVWQCRQHRFEIGRRPLVMGILNVTPDSFSDGGCYQDPNPAIEHGLQLVAEGADLLDIGGESTRPGSDPVHLEEELRRVIPIVRALAKTISVPISVDTSKGEVARQALEVGAAIINDVTGLRGDPVMPSIVKKVNAGVVVMHMQGKPATMQHDPQYVDVVREIGEFFRDRLRVLTEAGIDPACLSFDPGIGFGKTSDHNLDLLANLDRVDRFGRPITLGVSRKGFIGRSSSRPVPADRTAASLSVACFVVAQGAAHVLRVHDVASTRDAALMFEIVSRYRRN